MEINSDTSPTFDFSNLLSGHIKLDYLEIKYQ